MDILINREMHRKEGRRAIDCVARGEYEVAVREIGHLFEMLLRDLVQGSMASLPFAKRRLIADAEREIGEGKKGIESFTFGQIVGVLQKASLLDDLSDVFGQDCRPLSAVSLNTLRDIRNNAVHATTAVSLADAKLFATAYETFLAVFGVQIAGPDPKPQNMGDLKELIERSAASVEVIEGTVSFFKRLTEIVESDSAIDRFDATYLSELAPRVTRNQVLCNYWDTMRRKVLDGKVSLRRIVTWNNLEKLSWVLFSLVLRHQPVFDDLFQLALFQANRDSAGGHVMVPNLGLAYSSENMTDGHAWIYQHEETDRQNYIFFRGRSIFSTYRRIYNSWYASCRRLDPLAIRALYVDNFGAADSAAQVQAVMKRYKDRLGLTDEEVEVGAARWYDQFIAAR